MKPNVMKDGDCKLFGQTVRLVEKKRGNKAKTDKYYQWNNQVYRSLKRLQRAIEPTSDGNGVLTCDCDGDACVDVSPEDDVEPESGFEWVQRPLRRRVYCGCASCPGSDQYEWHQRRILRRRES